MDTFASLPMTLIAFIVALSVVVFVHEYGHLYVARRNRVRCDSFSIGFGPELFGWTDRHGTRWKVSAIPLGGYVKMFGEAETMEAIEGGPSPRSGDAHGEARPKDMASRPLTPEERAVSFKYKTALQRSAIVFAGPAVNIVFAILVFWAVFFISGRPVTEPVIGTVVADSAAAAAGFAPGDRVLAIDGQPVRRFEDIQRMVAIAHGAPMTFSVERDGTALDLTATPRIVEGEDAFGNAQKHALLGISVSGESRKMERAGPVEALGWSLQQCYVVMEGTVVAIGQMISGVRGTEDLGGPIRIAKYSGQAARSGVVNFVIFMAILSLNLGMINLLPVPLLDGGHLLFYAIEAVRGRPLSERVQEWGLRFGLALVVALMVFVTWNDIVQL
ncbi:MAG: RIP metalloprotease RseP [Rhodospirillaceae bacterium]|nr:RIP metalloprotease RseP [Rhodospirillaceae bacterium]